MDENCGRPQSEGTLNSESATSCVYIELAGWSARSTKPRRKIFLGTIERFEKLRGIRTNTVDHRIAGVPLSAVEPLNTMHYNNVKRSIEKFENHKKNGLNQNLRQTDKINKFSQESQDLIADMNNIEIFELCENYSKQQCPDCNAYWEM